MGRNGPEVKTIFIGALDREPGDDRAAYLDAACAGDVELRGRVDALLSAHEQASEVLGPSRDATVEAPTRAETAALVPDSGPTAILAADTLADAGGPNGDGLARGAFVRYFGDYEIQAELGRGGMGVVYQAKQVSLNRPVALKMLQAGLLAGEDDLRRFQNEAEAVALLDHPGIVPVYEVGEHEGRRYLSMKLVRGGNLAERLDAYKDDPRGAATLVAGAAEAVHHAHMRGILHRDLKPANILVDVQGHPHVTDFGLAKRMRGEIELTLSGTILGTPGYMSPEQAAGRRGTITTATDVYGLGSVLYALLTGRAPFTGESVVDTLQKVREQPPEPPRRSNAKLPRDLEVICLKCLEKDPRRRYSSALALADDLRAWLDSRPIAARPVGALTRVALWSRRRPAIAGLSAAIVLVALAGLAFGVFQWSASLRNARIAEANAAKANINEQRAAASAQEARSRGAELAESNRALQRTTYASVMRLAQREWERGDVGLARKVLGSLEPGPGRDDLRGFDWSFLRRQCGASLLTLPVSGAPPLNTGRSLSFSADGRRLAVALGEALAVFDANTGREVYRVTGSPHLDVAFSPCGRYLASLSLEVKGAVDLGGGAASPQTLIVRDATSYKPLRTIPARSGFQGVVQFSRDGDRIAVKACTYSPAAWLSTLTLFDVATGAEVRTLHDGKGIGTRPAFRPDGRLVASETGYNVISIWDAATGRAVRSITDPTAGMIRAVDFSPDGTRLASIADDGRAKVWDLSTGRPILALRVADQNGYAVRYSPDGLHLITADSEGVARVWDAETGEFLFLIRGVDPTLVYSPDGLRLATYGNDETVRLRDATGEMQSAVVGPLPGPVYSVAVGVDGELLATGDGSVWDSKTLARRYRVEAPAGVSWGHVAFSPDGRRLAVGGGRFARPGVAEVASGTVRVVEAASGRELLSFPEPRGFVVGVVISPDGRRLVSSGGAYKEKGWATLRDADTGRALRELEGFVQGADNVAFRPDSRALAYGGADAIHVRGVDDGAEVLTIRDLGGEPLSIGFSPDGRRLLAGVRKPDQREEIRIWDARDGRAELTIPIPLYDSVNRVIFSPDGKRLATGDFRALVRIWDASSGEELVTLKGHNSWVWSLAFSPDGTRLYSGSRDQTVRIWRADPPASGPAPEAPGLSLDPARLYMQAVALGQGGRYDKAEVLWRRFLETNRLRGLDDELATFSAQSQLGDCLARLGRHREAEPLLLRSYQQARTTPSAALSPGLLNDFRGRIIAFYDLAGQPDRAAYWRAEGFDAAFPAEPFAR
jgi:WD40 repeat protein